MRKKSSQTAFDRSGDRGFTLVATLLVVSLLTILIVSSLVVAQTEELAQYNASREEVARQNALFGLNQALNQLQMVAGPDRRGRYSQFSQCGQYFWVWWQPAGN